MKVFELIKTVLDDTWTEIPEPKVERVLRRIKDMSARYGDLTQHDPPDYADAITRFAYIYKYTSCHANLVAQKLASIPQVQHLAQGDTGSWLNVACIGGGPGSDFLGVIKYLMGKYYKGSLKCYLLDRESAWGDSWADVDQRTDTLDFRISTHFQVLDVTKRDTWESQSRYLKAQLFTFIYFISELYKKPNELEAYLAHVFDRASSGAMFLFVDNDKPMFYELFDGVAQARLIQVASKSERYVIDLDEQKTDLGDHFTRIGHQPKLQTYIAWRMYKKP